MLISLNWLEEFIDIDDIKERIPDALTAAGFEVEEVREIKSEFKGVVTAKILRILPHPSADRLTLCEVDWGKEVIRVVCGARNIKEGDICPLVLPGGLLPGGVRVEKRKIRGEVSYGMLCSEKELGLGEDASGIMILPADTEIGVDLSSIFRDDIVMEVAVTPNRGDCLSHLGIARELSAIFRREIKKPRVFEEIPAGESELIKIESYEGCPFYTGALVEGIEVKPSPLWMVARFRSLGVRSINNIVDITNYVLYEVGQPLHAFDFDRMDKGIRVRMGKKGERLVTIDHREREVDEEVLLICDASGPQAIAGVMGGLDSEVTIQTRRIFLESAYFTPLFIRRGARKLGLSSESSYRFERGVDPLGVEFGLRRGLFLIKNLLPACAVIGVYRNGEPPLKKTPIYYPFSFSEDFLGKEVGRVEAEEILKRLGFEVKADEKGMELIPPSWRHDITLKEDIAEELARIKGYDFFPSVPPSFPIRAPGRERRMEIIRRLKEFMHSFGFNEGIFYSFISEEFLKKCGFAGEPVRIINPLSREINVMRPSPLYSIFGGLLYNYRQKAPSARIYEVGKGFRKGDEGIVEHLYLSGGFYGVPVEKLWMKEGNEFFFMKGIITGIGGITGTDLNFLPPGESFLFDRGESASILFEGREIGVAGRISRSILKEMDVDESIDFYLFEVALDEILKEERECPSYQEFSRFPPVLRDLSIVVNEKVTWEDVRRCVIESGMGILEDVTIFDIYRDERIGEGKKSMSFHLIMRSKDSTLRDEEVDSVIEKILLNLKEKLGAELRSRT